MSELIAFAIGVAAMYGVLWVAAKYGKQMATEQDKHQQEREAVMDAQYDRLIALHERSADANERQAWALEHILERV